MSIRVPFCVPAVYLLAFMGCSFPTQDEAAAAETARWLVASANWGVVETLAEGVLSGEVMSFSDGVGSNLTGRPFVYVMCPAHHANVTYTSHQECPETYGASLTLSQAALNLSADGARDACAAQKSDPEDPRCAKLTLSGKMTKATGDAEALGKQALFARHPQMKQWPASHGFTVYELQIDDIWMIDFYGGGANIPPSKYYAAKPRHNVPHWPPAAYGEALSRFSNHRVEPPPYTEYAKRARWLVYHSTWTVVGTTSVRLRGRPWGNVRSTADLVQQNCTQPDPRCTTGLPVVYVPGPDPTAVDLSKDSRATLTFSEAGLPERIGAKGTCSGMDSEDPTCARLTLNGRLRPLADDSSELDRAKLSLGARHPLAPWLSSKGAHTGGKWYTIDIESLTFLDFYGGPAKLSVQEYLSAEAGNTDSADIRSFSSGDRDDDHEKFTTIFA